MSRLTRTLRAHLHDRRSRHEVERALADASSTAMRTELLIATQRHGGTFAR